MDTSKIMKIRELAEKKRESRKEEIDYRRLTAPCGLPCFECYVYLANGDPEMRTLISEVVGIPFEQVTCKGCRDEGGVCPHHIDVSCRVYPCAEERGVDFCSDCSDFPCDFIHPYADNAVVWHNTKVFNLCLIKKLGLETWAKEKARNVLETYSYGKWSL